MASDIDLTWRLHRRFLLDRTFRLVGDLGVAEDIVQEAFTRLATTNEAIREPRAWLTVVAGRLSLDHLRSARVKRETSLGEHTDRIPAAGTVDPADRMTLDDRVQQALFVMLDRLKPDERVTFVLHDVFDLPFQQIGEIVGRPAATCRQLAKRSRDKIAAGGVDPTAPAPVIARDRTEQFARACADGDLSTLVEVLLHPEAWGVGRFLDGTPDQVNHGAAAVAQNLVAFLSGGPTILAQPTVLLAYSDGDLFAALTLTWREDRVNSIEALIDPARRAAPAQRDPGRAPGHR